MSFNNLVVGQILRSDMCMNLRLVGDEEMIELNLGSMCNDIDESFLLEIARHRVQKVKLIIIRAAVMSQSLCLWIAKYVAPKLVHLELVECQNLTWNDHLKKMLEFAKNVESINLTKNKWVDDYTIEQISVKFQKSLKSINLEHTSVTDHALSFIGKRCAALRDLSLSVCPKVSDRGLSQLVRKVHLSSLHISHNHVITDAGIAALLSASGQLYSITLMNCPKLTDASIESIYEAIKAWGKRRNTKSLTIKSIVLQDNHLLTAQSLVFLSSAVPNLEILDIKGCANIDINKGLREMESLTSLKELTIGPSDYVINANELVESLLHHVAGLTLLHLVDIHSLEDEHVAELLNGCLLLEDLHVEGIEVGVHTIEALCSNVPNMKSIAILSSKALVDADVRCMTAVCLHLERLTLRRCNKLTDAAFTRCPQLLRLKHLDLNYVSKLMEGVFFANFTMCPLEYLSLDGLTLRNSSTLRTEIDRMSAKTRNSIKTLSLCNSSMIDSDDVSWLLQVLWNTSRIDLSGSGTHFPGSLLGLQHNHPFLSLKVDRDFIGYIESDAAYSKHARYRLVNNMLGQHRTARKIQRYRRKYNDKVRLAREAELKAIKQHKDKNAILIQSKIRSIQMRTIVNIKLGLGRRIVKQAQRWLQHRLETRYKYYMGLYRAKISRDLFMLLRAHTTMSKGAIGSSLSKLNPAMRRRIKKRIFDSMKDTEEEMREGRLYSEAVVLWESHILKRIVEGWKTMRGRSAVVKKKLVTMLMLAMPAALENSSRQLAYQYMADDFLMRRRLVVAWVCINDDFIRARKAELLMPKAADHFENTFFDRVVNACYQALVYYVESKKVKREALRKAPIQYRHWTLFNGFRYSKEERERRIRFKHFTQEALEYRRLYGITMALQNRFINNVYHRIFQRSIDLIQYEHWCKVKVLYYMESFKFNARRLRIYRKMMWKADTKRNLTYWRRFFDGWQEFFTLEKNMSDIVYKEYMYKICRKIFDSFRIVVKEGREYKSYVSSKLSAAVASKASEEEKEEDFGVDGDNEFPVDGEGEGGEGEEKEAPPELTEEEKAAIEAEKEAERKRLAQEAKEAQERAMQALIAGVTNFQAIVRGGITRAWYMERYVAVVDAVQRIQNFFRRILSRLLVRRITRKNALQQVLREESETNAMWRMDQFSQLFRTCWNEALLIQRIFRGYTGRIQGAIKATAISKEKSTAFYAEMKGIRRNLEALRAAIERRKKLQYAGATMIQKRIRGMIARRKFIRIRMQAQKVRLTIAVQRDYRRRLGMMKLLGMRRAKVGEIRFRAARRQRGMLLRMIGFRKRKQQATFGFALQELGIDPLTYNYRFMELISETWQDAKQFWSIIKREYNIVKEAGLFDKVKQEKLRRKILEGQLVNIKVLDPVRVMDITHPYVGYTGQVTRIDTSIPGTPLYEVKLDGLKRQIFVNMTTDALTTYKDVQPLAKIDKKPKLRDFFQPFVLYGVNEGDPMFNRRNITAAWTIQRAFRVYRAHKLVARKRYESWVRACDMQGSFFSHLAETNTLTTQANNILDYLGVRPSKPIKFDEVRHPTVSGRYLSNLKKPNELKNMKEEFEAKYRERLLFLNKASVSDSLEYFSKGYQQLTGNYKMKLALRRFFGHKKKKGSISTKDAVGAKGIRDLAQNKSLVEGLAHYNFPELDYSPHIRYYKTYMYQGQWTGIPMFTPLRPHGEGVLIFMDGWGFAREEKVVYVEIVACRHLNAADIDTSDPYIKLTCNGYELESSVKWRNLNPVYNEKFEIDVTNNGAKLNIAVFDYDYIGSDDFLGQIELRLSDYADGIEKEQTFMLKGEDVDFDEDFDRGEIDVRIRWTNRKFDNDLRIEDVKNRKATIIQAWARRIASLSVRDQLVKRRQELLALVKKRSIQITNTCRIRLATKKLKRLRRRYQSCIKIQKRARIRQAKKKYFFLKSTYNAAVAIQKHMRRCLAFNIVKRIKDNNKAALDSQVTSIQTMVRRKIAYIAVALKRAQRNLELEAARAEADDDFDDDEEEPSVSSWIKIYGVDPEYGLRRNRRMTMAYFEKILTMQYIRLMSRYGPVYVEEYPAPTSDEDLLAIKEGEVPLTNREDFVSVYLPQFGMGTHRTEAIEIFNQTPHRATIALTHSIDLRKTVDFNVITIQCAARQKMARNQKEKIIGLHKAFAKLQRRFRARNEVKNKAAMLVTALFHLIHAKFHTAIRRAETRGAGTIQRAFRCYRARAKAFDRRCVTDLIVLKYSSAVPFHGPAKALEFRYLNFWMTDSPEIAEMRLEMKKQECVTEVWIQTSTLTASPRFVSIHVVKDKSSKTYLELIPKTELMRTRGAMWHKFEIKELVAKYFKLTFTHNYGDDKHIGIRQIRFMRAKERSPTIIEQPSHHIMTRGPTVGRIHNLTLHCPAHAWPYPTYQWYRNGQLIPDATKDTLHLSLKCPFQTERRTFRCLKCKMFSRNIPNNAYYLICDNCDALFNYKDIKEYEDLIKSLHVEEAETREVDKKLKENYEQMEGMIKSASTDTAKARMQYLKNDLITRMAEADATLQNLRESRYSAKNDLQSTNSFTDEGVYYCLVTNIRGGSIPITRKSVRAVVVVEHSIPYRAKVKPYYRPRIMEVRKKWTTYSSIRGSFNRGHIEGIVTVRYSEGSFYEGPYVPEKWLDATGRVAKEARAENHYGVFVHEDGRIFEGSEVDNHFDPLNLNSFYRLTLRNGEIYEGMFCDESYHGTGIYRFRDGSTYEGHWHRGSRFGHGHFRFPGNESEGAEAWTYEGGFNNDKLHGNGILTKGDGSTYIGQFYYNKQQGVGILISTLRDVYKGQIQDGVKHGFGELLYADGSRHIGNFRTGKRHGKGIFKDAGGHQYYGHFVEEYMHGELIVKEIIPVEEEGQNNFEIRIGVYEMGKFIKWKLKYSNPQITKQFITMFNEDKSMFDSVYSMILAKTLPHVPEGVNRTHPEVVEILRKLRNDAGGLVGQGALQAAQQQFDNLLTPIKKLRQEIIDLKQKIEEMSLGVIEKDKDAADLMNKYGYLMGDVDKESERIEQFWIDDATESRVRFQHACKALETVEVNEFFTFRNHRIPPPFTKKIMDAVCLLLNRSREWKDQQTLISTSIVCGREGDDDGLRFEFDCKLAFMMKTYNVYANTQNAIDNHDLESILCDPRLRRDSYYVESCGPAGPALVDWIKSNYQYVKNSQYTSEALTNTEEKKRSAYTYRAHSNKRSDEVKVMQDNIQVLRDQVHEKERELLDMDEALAKVADILDFISANDFKTDEVKNEDYYLEMEQKIEANRDAFIVETAVQFLVDKVESVRDYERRIKMRDARARGETYVEPEIDFPQIKQWIIDEVRSEQARVEGEGRNLGYNIEPAENEISWDETQFIIDMIVLRVVGKLNEKYNDFASSLEWTTITGRKFDSRFLYIYAWKFWENFGEEAKEVLAESKWASEFSEDMVAIKSIEAKVNERMGDIAKEQARIWAKRNKVEILKAEEYLSQQFQVQNPEETARTAFEIDNSTDPGIPPETKAMCVCWIRLHPEEMGEVRDEQNMQLADDYIKEFKDKAGELAVKIFNDFATEEEQQWREYAEQYKSFYSEDYRNAFNKLVDDNAAVFADTYPNFTAMEAAGVVENHTLATLVLDPEVAEELQVSEEGYMHAKCWGLRNVGLLRAADGQLESANSKKLRQLWLDLENQTEGWRKGSHLNLDPAAQANPDLDRYAGFRARLENKFAWVYGYLSKKHIDLFEEIYTFDSKDPMGKVLHGVRPSQYDKFKKNIEDSFLKHKKHTEATVADVIAKIGTWNSYFGVKEEDEEGGEGMEGADGGSVAGGSVASGEGKEAAPPADAAESTEAAAT